jgi:hypothetical protein
VRENKEPSNNNNNNKLHNGSAYYFWVITCILKDDLQKGFLLRHRALEEDTLYLSNIRDTPSYAFVTLNCEQDDIAGMFAFLLLVNHLLNSTNSSIFKKNLDPKRMR